MTNTTETYTTETYTTYAVRYWVVGHGEDATATRRLNVVIPSSQGVVDDTLLAVLRQTCAQEAGAWSEMVEVTHHELVDTP